MRRDMARTQEKKQRGAQRAKAEQAMDHVRGDVFQKDLKNIVGREKEELKNKAKAKEELKRTLATDN